MASVPQLPERVSVLLGEIEPVREIIAVSEQSELTRELKGLLAGLSKSVRNGIPTLHDWPAPEIRERSILFSPGPSWKVLRSRSALLRDHSVALVIDLSEIVVPDPLWKDAYVGLYAPAAWSKLKYFRTLLRKFKLNKFEHIDDQEDAELYDETVPLWSYVKYADYAKQGVFNVKGFIAAILLRMGVLVKCRKEIESMIQMSKEH